MSKSAQPFSLFKSASSKTFKQAFVLKKNPFPWVKAFCAGLCAAIPVFIGLLLGNFEYGLTSGIGAFTFLYMFNQPFAQRAKKLFFVMIGLSLCVGLGTISAPYPFVATIMMGIIGALVIFIFGALKITGPSAVFFILCYAMATGMPDRSIARSSTCRSCFSRRGVILGDCYAWLFFQPPRTRNKCCT